MCACQASFFLLTYIGPLGRKAFGHTASPHCWLSNNLKIDREIHAGERAEVRMPPEEVVNFICETFHTATLDSAPACFQDGVSFPGYAGAPFASRGQP